MSVLRNIISLKRKGLNNRAISRQLGLSHKTANNYIHCLKQTGLSYQDLLQLSDVELAALVDTAPSAPLPAHLQVLFSYFPTVEKELKRVGVARHLLWKEYKQLHPDGISYARFCAHFLDWRQRQEVSMHLEHKAGDKVFVDFIGKKVEAVANQKVENFIGALHRAFSFFDGPVARYTTSCGTR